MDRVVYFKKPELNNPVMITGWPGMGNVALGVSTYMRKALHSMLFCEIDAGTRYSSESVIVEQGLARLPPPPKTRLYYSKAPDLIIVEGDAQLSHEAGAWLLDEITRIAEQFAVRTIFSGAAFPLPVSYADSPELYGAANTKELVHLLTRYGVMVMDEGQISGLNGLILGHAKNALIGAACLLSTMPQYAIGFSNPKASRAIIERLSRIVQCTIDLKELDETVRDVDEKMAIIEGQTKEAFSFGKPEKDVSAHSESKKKKVPESVKQKIERLFREARRDKTKAPVLKNELDRWDLYTTYEDRFLDLFRESV